MKNIKSILFRFDTLIIGFIILYTLAALTVSLNRYWQYQSFYYDFGFYDTAIWQAAHLQLPIVDFVNFKDQEKIIFANHFNPSLFLLSPLYWFTDRREILLIWQSLSVGLAAFIAFRLAREKLKSGIAVLALVVSFLGYIGLQNALISEFHDITLAVLPLTVLFWAIAKKHWKLFFLFLLILLGLKESLAGLGVGLGVYILLRERRYYQIALLTIVLSVLWGYVTTRHIIPFFEGDLYYFTPANLPSNPIEWLSVFVDNPTKLQTVFYSFLTFGFLPIFDIAVLPSILENFFERFVLSSDKRWDLGLHYNATLSPLMFMGSIAVYSFMESRKKLKLFVPLYSLVVILMVVVLHRFILHGPLGLFYNPVFYQQNERVRYVDEFVKNFPQSGLIMTQNDLALRLSHQRVKLLRSNYQKINPDHVILNLTPGQNPNSFFPLSYEKAIVLKDNLSQDKSYTLKKYAAELYIFSKN